MCSIQQSRGRERMMKKPDVSLHKMFTLNFTWADFILGLIDGSIMALIQLLALGLIARQHNISSTSCGNPTCREFYGTYCTSQSGLDNYYSAPRTQTPRICWQ